MKSIEKEILVDCELGHEFARRECMIHAQVHHPNIIRVLDTCETADRYIIYMEYAGIQSNYLQRKISSHQTIN